MSPSRRRGLQVGPHHGRLRLSAQTAEGCAPSVVDPVDDRSRLRWTVVQTEAELGVGQRHLWIDERGNCRQARALVVMTVVGDEKDLARRELAGLDEHHHALVFALASGDRPAGEVHCLGTAVEELDPLVGAGGGATRPHQLAHDDGLRILPGAGAGAGQDQPASQPGGCAQHSSQHGDASLEGVWGGRGDLSRLFGVPAATPVPAPVPMLDPSVLQSVRRSVRELARPRSV